MGEKSRENQMQRKKIPDRVHPTHIPGFWTDARVRQLCASITEMSTNIETAALQLTGVRRARLCDMCDCATSNVARYIQANTNAERTKTP